MAGGQMSSGGAAGAGGAFETGGTVATGGVEAGGSAGAMNSAGTGTVDSVDATEVTRSAYEAWLATSPSLGDQVAECVGNSSFTPSCDWPPGSLPEHPVVCVDWCDANAYCLAQGRRLCGNVNGGAIAFTDYDNPTLSQWFRACSSGGQFSYPYGNTYSGTTCNGSAAGYATTVAVGTLSACQSPDATFSGVYDLSGNVYEWIDSCRTSDDA
jgi:formylglycine-generating enzyme required for sulfatase activity